MEPVAQFGQNLLRLRTRAGLTQEQLAFRCNMEATIIGKLERGERDPRLTTMVRVAAGLDLPVEALVQGVGAPE